MKHELSRAVIEQLSSNILEITANENIVVDKDYLDECWKFYDEQQKTPFGLLINLKNQHSCSFEGSRDTGAHPLIQKTAFLHSEDDYHSKEHVALIQQVKEITGYFLNHEIFTDRDEAIKWLSDIVALPKETPTKYELSFCEIEQLSENVFEVINNENVVIDKKCTDEDWNFWNDLRDKAFGLLVNYKHQHNLSFEGSRDIGRHNLQHKTAILLHESDRGSERQLELMVQIKKMAGHIRNQEVFTDRDEAIKWLSDI